MTSPVLRRSTMTMTRSEDDAGFRHSASKHYNRGSSFERFPRALICKLGVRWVAACKLICRLDGQLAVARVRAARILPKESDMLTVCRVFYLHVSSCHEISSTFSTLFGLSWNYLDCLEYLYVHVRQCLALRNAVWG